MSNSIHRNVDGRAVALHATAIAIAGRAVIIQGASKSGKSTLAAALCKASALRSPIELIGDDRVLLAVRCNRTIVVRPHPRIAGFIERRGLGIVAMAFRDEAPVSAVVQIGSATNQIAMLQNLPALTLVDAMGACERLHRVLSWWSVISGEAQTPQLLGKAPLTMLASL